jgi:hypothetical protein
MQAATHDQDGTANSLLKDPMYADIPERFRTPIAPRDLAERAQYFKAWILHIQMSPHFTPAEKARLLRSYGRRLEKAEVDARNEHPCICCGIILRRTPGPIGPECVHHYPPACNAHRGRR